MKNATGTHLPRYSVVGLGDPVACTLASDMCVSSSSGAITGYSALTFPPYGQSPVPPPTEALNRYKLAGRAGDRCLVVWAEALDDWIIAQVAHHEIKVPLADRFHERYLQAKPRKIAAMYCEDETDWRNEIKLEEAEIVDDVRFTGCGSSSGPARRANARATAATGPNAREAAMATATLSLGSQHNVEIVRSRRCFVFFQTTR